MDMNLASLAGHLNARKRSYRELETVAPKVTRRDGLRRLFVAASVLLTVIGL